MKLRKDRLNNRGFSLVEVIVSMAILAIIAVPLLSYFVTSAEYNARAKNRQKAVVLAQSIMEQCKDKSIEEIAKSFHTTSNFPTEFTIVSPTKLNNDASRVEEVDAFGNSVGTKGGSGSYIGNTFTNSADGMLYYAVKNIEEDGNRYDALITIDTNTTVGDTYYDTNINQKLYEIKAIKSPKNVVAVETTQQARAIIHMSDLNRTYCENQNAAHASDSTWTYLVPESEANILNALRRNMYIDIDPIGSSNTQVKVKIYYKYYCPGISECPTDMSSAIEIDPPLYQETVLLSDLKNMYLFFLRDKDDEQIFLDIDQNAADDFIHKLNLYLLCQADLTGTVPEFDISLNPVGNSFTKIDKVFSNAKKVSILGAGNDIKETDGYIEQSSVLRMMNITVDIYREGHLLDSDNLYATLQSTKGK
jgi:prepilin-type N-terminal cleavage/methylation domain-containing protein